MKKISYDDLLQEARMHFGMVPQSVKDKMLNEVENVNKGMWGNDVESIVTNLYLEADDTDEEEVYETQSLIRQ